MLNFFEVFTSILVVGGTVFSEALLAFMCLYELLQVFQEKNMETVCRVFRLIFFGFVFVTIVIIVTTYLVTLFQF